MGLITLLSQSLTRALDLKPVSDQIAPISRGFWEPSFCLIPVVSQSDRPEALADYFSGAHSVEGIDTLTLPRDIPVFANFRAAVAYLQQRQLSYKFLLVIDYTPEMAIQCLKESSVPQNFYQHIKGAIVVSHLIKFLSHELYDPSLQEQPNFFFSLAKKIDTECGISQVEVIKNEQYVLRALHAKAYLPKQLPPEIKLVRAQLKAIQAHMTNWKDFYRKQFSDKKTSPYPQDILTSLQETNSNIRKLHGLFEVLETVSQSDTLLLAYFTNLCFWLTMVEEFDFFAKALQGPPSKALQTEIQLALSGLHTASADVSKQIEEMTAQEETQALKQYMLKMHTAVLTTAMPMLGKDGLTPAELDSFVSTLRTSNFESFKQQEQISLSHLIVKNLGAEFVAFIDSLQNALSALKTKDHQKNFDRVIESIAQLLHRVFAQEYQFAHALFRGWRNPKEYTKFFEAILSGAQEQPAAAGNTSQLSYADFTIDAETARLIFDFISNEKKDLYFWEALLDLADVNDCNNFNKSLKAAQKEISSSKLFDSAYLQQLVEAVNRRQIYLKKNSTFSLTSEVLKERLNVLLRDSSRKLNITTYLSILLLAKLDLIQTKPLITCDAHKPIVSGLSF